MITIIVNPWKLRNQIKSPERSKLSPSRLTEVPVIYTIDRNFRFDDGGIKWEPIPTVI